MMTILHRAAQWPAPQLHRIPSSGLCALPKPRAQRAEIVRNSMQCRLSSWNFTSRETSPEM